VGNSNIRRNILEKGGLIMKTIFKILIFGNSEIGRFKLLHWYLEYMKMFKNLGFTKEQINNSYFIDSFLNSPYLAGHCSLGQILNYFQDEDIQKLVDAGKLDARKGCCGWNA